MTVRTHGMRRVRWAVTIRRRRSIRPGRALAAPITPGVSNHQLDTCWVVNNGKFAYGANYTSGTVSSYTIGDDGDPIHPYYGAAETSIALATGSINELLAWLDVHGSPE